MSPEEMAEKKVCEAFEETMETMKKLDEDHKERVRRIEREFYMILIGVVVLVFVLVPVFIKLWRG